MSHKWTWACKCGIRHNITKKQIDNKKIRECKDCSTYPSKEQISKALAQIQNKKTLSIAKQVAKKL